MTRFGSVRRRGAVFASVLSACLVGACGRTNLFLPSGLAPGADGAGGFVASAGAGAGNLGSGGASVAGAGGAGTGGSAGSDACTQIAFADAVLEERVRDAVKKPEGPLVGEDVAGLRELSVADEAIIDLGGIECLTALRELDLSQNDLLELGPLGALVELETLDLSGNDIEDLSPLAELGRLQTLDVSDNELTSLEPLRALNELTRLDVSKNELRDLSPLSGFGRLSELACSENGLFDIGPLAGLSKLEVLEASGNALEDLTPLGALSNLRVLDLRESISPDLDLGALSGLRALRSLDLSCNIDVDVADFPALPLVDLAPLVALASLEELHLQNCPIASLVPLRQTRALRTLNLENALVSEPTPLADLVGLTELSFHLFTDWAGDASRLLPLPASLRKLDIRFTTGHDVDLASLPDLEVLHVQFGSDMYWPHLLGLESATQLRELDLQNTGTFQPNLAALPELRSFRANLRPEIGISTIAALRHLQHLDFGNVSGVDLSPLASLTELRSLKLWGCPARLPELPALERLETGIPEEQRTLETLTGLRELHLQGCNWGYETLEIDLGAFQALEVLDLAPPGCGWVRARDPGQLSLLPRLRTLILGNASMTPSNCGGASEPMDWAGFGQLGDVRTLSVAETQGDWPSLPKLRRLTVFSGAQHPRHWPDLPRLREVQMPSWSGIDVDWDASELEQISRFDLTDLHYATASGALPQSPEHLRRLSVELGPPADPVLDASAVSTMPELQHLTLNTTYAGPVTVLASGHDRLRSLDLRAERVIVDSESAAFPNLLSLSSGTLTFEGTAFPKLRTLRAAMIDSFDFAASPKLEAIDLWLNWLNDPIAPVRLPALPELRSLQFSGGGLELPSLPELRRLLFACPYNDGPPVELTFDEQPKLRSAWIGPCGGEGIAPLASHDFLASLPAVEQLVLHSSELTDLNELELLPHPEKLRRLWLIQYQDFDGSGLRVDPNTLGALSAFPLESLYISLPVQTDLALLPSLPSLRLLHLDYAPASLIGIPSMPSLRHLWLKPRAQCDFPVLADYMDLGAGDVLVVPAAQFDCEGPLAETLLGRGVSVMCPFL